MNIEGIDNISNMKYRLNRNNDVAKMKVTVYFSTVKVRQKEGDVIDRDVTHCSTNISYVINGVGKSLKVNMC